MRLLATILVAYLTLSPVTTYAATWHVPAQCPTIQAGIDSASAGDTVLVAAGTYTGEGNRDIDYLGKLIVVKSVTGDPSTCVIDCGEAARGFYFHWGEWPEAVLEGMTFTNGGAVSTPELFVP
ncbi:MAG: hypothetical protein KAW17_01765 [Candidatus Eisenbacteria sp.]|nr:hypothetical protein [Candidatus Eisenbacteria bacterium]